MLHESGTYYTGNLTVNEDNKDSFSNLRTVHGTLTVRTEKRHLPYTKDFQDWLPKLEVVGHTLHMDTERTPIRLSKLISVGGHLIASSSAEYTSLQVVGMMLDVMCSTSRNEFPKLSYVGSSVLTNGRTNLPLLREIRGYIRTQGSTRLDSLFHVEGDADLGGTAHVPILESVGGDYCDYKDPNNISDVWVGGERGRPIGVSFMEKLINKANKATTTR